MAPAYQWDSAARLALQFLLISLSEKRRRKGKREQ